MSRYEEFRRGWRIVLAAALGVGLGISPLPLYSIGILTKPLCAEFGWSRAAAQAFLSFSTTGVIVGSPLLGLLVDRFGLRRVLLTCVAGFALGFLLLGVATRGLASFYGFALVIGLFGAGTNSVAWSRLVFDWFEQRPGLALGLALCGTGISASFLPALTTWMLGSYGWRGAYVGLALLPACITFPVAWRYVRPAPASSASAIPGDPGVAHGATLRQAVRGYRFWCVGVGFFLVCAGTSGVIPHLVPMLTDRGYSASEAARVAALQGVALIGGRLVTGYCIDRLWAPGLAAVSLGLPAIACWLLAGDLADPAVTTISALAVGFAGGAEFDLIAYITRRYFGLRHYGSIYGVLYAMFACATVIAPPLFGHAFDAAGNYHFALQVAAGCFLAGTLLILALGRYPLRT